jgi:alkaline phosphatase D
MTTFTLRRRTLLAAASAASLGACAGKPLIAAAENVTFRIGVASCADQNKPQPIWDAALAENPDLFVFGGDNVYASEPPFDVAKLRAAYAELGAKANFEKLRSTVPHLVVWDDHDYGLNDGGAEFAHKQASKDEFLRFWRVANDDPRRSREGLYHARMFEQGGKRVQVIGLDTRWFRSAWKPTDERNAPGKERYVPDPDPAKTMLGDAQWRWLEARLRAGADVNVIVSSIQCVVEGHGYERWGNLPTERERLYRLIRNTGARGTVVVSGDRHIGGIYKEANATLPYPLYELTSSGVTHPWTTAKEAGPNRIEPLVTAPHYGVVTIDFTAREIKLSLRDVSNRPLHEHAVSLAALRVA